MRKLIFVYMLLVGGFQSLEAQPFSVMVNTTAVPPVNPVISQYVSSGSINSSLLYGSVGMPPLQVYVQGRIECLSPSPFTISVNPSYTGAGMITLTPGVPTQLIATQLLGAFGFFNDNNLVATGVNINSIKDGNNNIKLPPGVYRICFVAKQPDPASGQPGINLSDPNLGCGNFTVQNTQPANGVIINTVVIPPASPAITSFILTGGVKPTLLYNTPGGNTSVKLFGKIERIAPAPFTLSLNPGYSQQQPITLSPGVPLQLTGNQVMDAFGNFIDNNLVVSGIGLNELKDAANNFKLPDGTYRICFYARYVDPASGGLGTNASDPATGCGNFGICANASAPQFTQPVSNFNISSIIAVLTPGSPVIFAWTPPVSTCGGQMGVIRYDFEIHELFESQTVTDAINNPPVFMKRELPSPSFILDTNLYKNILQRGKKYVIRVRANAATNAMVQKVDNNGYSRIEAFQYGDAVAQPPGPPIIPVNNNPNQPPVTPVAPPGPPIKPLGNNPPNNNEPPDNLPPNKCAGVVAPSNTTAFAGAISELQDKDLPIGKFKLHTGSTLTKNNDGTYTGDGYIEWTPMMMTIRLRVKFTDIKVNTDKAIYDGVVRTTTEPASYTWTPIATADDITKAVGLSGDQAYKDVREFINSKAKFINMALGNTPIDMPLGWNADIGGTQVTMAIMAISFAPTGTNLNVFTGFDIPEASGWLNMAGTNFCINPVGTVVSDGTLYLPNDRDFNLGTNDNNWNFKFKGSGPSDTAKGTYVNIKNGKLEKVMARAEIAFPKNVMVPEDNDGKVTDGSVISKIEFRFANWNDWMGTIDMPHFQLKDAPGISLQTSKVYYDHSNKEDPAGFKYPLSTDVPAGNTFMGVYIEQMKILLPEDFKTFNNSNKRTEFSAGNFIVESAGISADIQGKNIIGLGVDKTGEGSMGGFAFSLDNFQLVFEKNTYKKGSLDGNFWLPVSSTALHYSGNLRVEKDSLRYDFLIAPEKNYQFDVWAASVDLDKNSHISLKRDSKGAAVEAILNGNIGFSLSSSPKITLNLLKFDSLGISNRNPVTKKDEFWFHPGTWAFTGLGGGNKSTFNLSDPLQQYKGSYAGGPNYNYEGEYNEEDQEPEPFDSKDDQSVGGFPININGIKPVVDFKSNMSVRAGIGFNINVGIGGKDKTIISASAGLSIAGIMKFDINGLEKPSITLKGDVQIDSLKVKGDVGPLQVDGALVFYKSNSTYGDGVKGRVSAKFPVAKVEATAQFGNVNGFHYWFIDACATFAKPIPIAGFLGLGGFGGGAYYNMSMDTPTPDVSKLEQISLNANAKDMTPGKSMSGISYSPKSGVFGLKAAAILTLSSSGEAFNAKVTLSGEFLDGALNKFGLEGEAFFITDYPDNKKPTVTAVVNMVYDIPKETFSLDAAIDAKVVTATAHIPISVFASPAGWYIKVGDPFGERAKITFIDKPKEKGSSYEAHLGATAYFIAGTLITIKLPDLPEEISSKIQRDPSTLQLLEAMSKTPADGFQLGARVDGSFRASFAILYAQAKAIVGFDLALMHFKQQISCNGTPMGWNDWYAIGQLYAYLSAEVGVHVNVWFYEGDLSLCKIEVAAALQGGLPNPAWAEGTAYVHGEVLGGLISVSQDFHIRIGDKCYPVGDPLKDIQIISDYGPKVNGDVYDDPYLVSNVGLENNFTINLPPSEKFPAGEVRTFQFRIKTFDLYRNGQLIPSSGIKLENNNMTAKLKFRDMFEPRKEYRADYACEVFQYYPNEDRWDYPLNEKNIKEARVETGHFSFTTGDAPEYIRDDQVNLLYPVKYQRYVLRNEFNGKGTMGLDRWPSNILIGDGQGKMAYKKYSVKYIAVGSADTVTSNFEVDEANHRINFALPAALKKNTVYKAEFWSLPGASSSISAFRLNVTNSTRNYNGVQAQVKTTTAAEGSKRSADHDPIFVTYFRTSNYNSLQEKVNAYGNWNAIKGSNYSINIQNDEIIPESFDEIEIKGFASPNGTAYPPLLNVRIDWDKSRQNDAFGDANMYDASFTLGLNSVTTLFGMNQVRNWKQPVYTLDFSKLPADKPLNTTESGEFKPKSTGMMSMKFMGSSSQVSNSSSMQSSISFSMYASLKWQRDYYINQDFLLMRNFSSAVEPLMQQFRQQFSPSQLETALSNMNDDYQFTWNWIGGTVSMPLNKFYNLYNNSSAMNIVNKLRNTSFMEFQKGKRNLLFQYRLGNTSSGSVTRSFNY